MKGITLLVMMCMASGTLIAQARRDTSSRDALPPPNATRSAMNFSHVTGWEDNLSPAAPDGFVVTRYAEGFENPRWFCVLPNGDVLVAESNTYHPWYERFGAIFIGANKSNNLHKSADRITLLRDADGDGKPETRKIFLENLNQPFGMLILGNWFYVANTDALWRFPYQNGQTTITGKGEKIIDLPAGKHNRHWTRNMIASKDGKKIYIAVGSGTNVAEKGIINEYMRANILEINPDGSALRVYASGLRNPVGMDWAPGTSTLWTVVNERDELGDDLVPDYLTGVKEDGFYGWPFNYFGAHQDARVKEARPPITEQTLIPDMAIGSHTASLGLVFYDHTHFPARYHKGAFIAQHGSWNRSTLSGYKIIFVPFANGKPAGKAEDFVSFMDDVKKDKVHGRPVGITVISDGSLIVADDVNGIVWKIAAKK